MKHKIPQRNIVDVHYRRENNSKNKSIDYAEQIDDINFMGNLNKV